MDLLEGYQRDTILVAIGNILSDLPSLIKQRRDAGSPTKVLCDLRKDLRLYIKPHLDVDSIVYFSPDNFRKDMLFIFDMNDLTTHELATIWYRAQGTPMRLILKKFPQGEQFKTIPELLGHRSFAEIHHEMELRTNPDLFKVVIPYGDFLRDDWQKCLVQCDAVAYHITGIKKGITIYFTTEENMILSNLVF